MVNVILTSPIVPVISSTCSWSDDIRNGTHSVDVDSRGYIGFLCLGFDLLFKRGRGAIQTT